jgi:hypothetical protein
VAAARRDGRAWNFRVRCQPAFIFMAFSIAFVKNLGILALRVAQGMNAECVEQRRMRECEETPSRRATKSPACPGFSFFGAAAQCG